MLDMIRLILLFLPTLLLQARSSVGEHFPDTEGVGGSIPPVPTNFTACIYEKEASFDVFFHSWSMKNGITTHRIAGWIG